LTILPAALWPWG